MTFRRINRGSGHSYEDDGVPVPGVTTVLRSYPKDFSYSAAKMVAGWAGDNHDRLADLTPSAVTAQALDHYQANRYGPRDRGKIIHALADRLLRGEEVDVEDDVRPTVDTFLQWARDYRVEPIATEASVLNRSAGYAGTVDLIANVLGHLALIDYKTGRTGIWPETVLQLAAYSWAEVYVDDDGTEHPMPLGLDEPPTSAKPDGSPRFEMVAALWLQDDRYELRPVAADRFAFLTFRYVDQVRRFADLDRYEVIGDPISPFDALHLGVAS